MDALGRVVKIDRTNNIPMETTAGIFNDLLRFYNVRNCNIEVNGVGIGMWEIMSKTNKQLTKWVTTNENKAIGIQQLIRGCEETTLELPSEELMPEVINEFQAFTYKQLASGRLQFSAPSGYHDDIVMATMMANEARRSGHLKRNKLYIGQR